MDEEPNPYELLSVAIEATEQEIRTAYRQRSLKVHPDRNPNNPDAARKFHELNQAYELLLDPLRRMAVDAKLRLKQARAERFKSYDTKRKNLVEELEERERAFKKARMEKQKDEAQAWQDAERIKEEGKRLREQKEKEMRERMMKPSSVPVPEAPSSDEEPPPAMDPLDTTVRVKYPFKTHPTLTTPAAIASFMSHFGSVDESSIVLSSGKSKTADGAAAAKEKKPKTGTALVPFRQIGDAFAAVCASENVLLGMEGVKVTWVNGKEPEILGWLKRTGKLGTTPSSKTPRHKDQPSSARSPSPGKTNGVKADLPQNKPSADSATPFSSFPSTFPDIFPSSDAPPAPAAPGIDYESLTLMRMRQAERERLEREILEREAAGEE